MDHGPTNSWKVHKVFQQFIYEWMNVTICIAPISFRKPNVQRRSPVKKERVNKNVFRSDLNAEKQS